MTRLGTGRVQLPAPARRGSAPAFTLIEVVVGLALGVVLLAAVQRIVVGAYRTSGNIEQRSAADAARARPFQLLAADLQDRPAGGGLTLHDGVLTLPTLHAMQSPRVAARHVVSVRYRLEPAARGSFQIGRAEREPDDDVWTGAGVPLAEGVATVTIDVFDGERWHPEWPQSVPRMARAVRLTIEWSTGQRAERIVPLTPLQWRRHDE